MISRSFSDIPDDTTKLDAFIRAQESQFDLKEGTQAQIIWNGKKEYKKTEYSLVYLHGFRASHPEGNPVHKRIAESFGYNLFLSRMDEHGVKAKYPLLNLTEEKMLHSAQFAFEIGKRLGEKVILMGTSTGASLALYLASKPAFKPYISSLILYSPLIRFYGINNQLLTNSIGRTILKRIPGNKFLITSKESTFAEDKIWNKRYAMAGAIALGRFVEHQMKESLFNKVTHPAFIGYYYKNKREQDKVVSVRAIKKMIPNFGTRTKLLKICNFPDAQTHVICNFLLSKAVNGVIDNTKKFLKMVGSHEHSDK